MTDRKFLALFYLSIQILLTWATEYNYQINKSWDGVSMPQDAVNITLEGAPSGIVLTATAPYHNDPPPKNIQVGQPYPGLWEYEVAEAFFLNKKNQYLEVELSPHGVHLLLLLNGYRTMIKDKLPLNYTAEIHNNRWKGVANIPAEYFPAKVNRFNAYAIHGTGDDRKYMALYPVPAGAYPAPDFHRLEAFQDIDFQQLLPENYDSSYSSTEWPEIIG